MRYRATLAYDGSAYQGFQRQAQGAPTIQGTVEAAVAQVTGQTVTVTGAGRTDTGVHAVGQVITFDVEWQHDQASLLRALNATLPDDIALQDIAEAPGFHPRYDAVSRLYCYTVYQAAQRHPLLRQRAWHVRGGLDEEALYQTAAMLVGERNYRAFGKPPKGENAVRAVYRSEWTAEAVTGGVLWMYHVEANAFLQHMVRRMVGMQIDVGRGLRTPAAFESVVQRAEPASSWTIAPPQGLVLEHVKY